MDALSVASKIGGDECDEGAHFLEIETMLLQREQNIKIVVRQPGKWYLPISFAEGMFLHMFPDVHRC